MNIKITILTSLEASALFFRKMLKHGNLGKPFSDIYPYKFFDINSPVKLV